MGLFTFSFLHVCHQFSTKQQTVESLLTVLLISYKVRTNHNRSIIQFITYITSGDVVKQAIVPSVMFNFVKFISGILFLIYRN